MNNKPALNWINGQWLDSGHYLDSINPATYDVIGQFAEGGESEAQQAIAAAQYAFHHSRWKKDRQLRALALLELADAFARHTEELIDILALENGKIKAEARFEITMVPQKLRYYAALVRAEYGRAAEPEPGKISMVLRQAAGVAGIIVPWNSPVVLMIRSLAPALAAGCTTVIKMPGQTAQTNALIAQIISEVTSIPDGTINLFSESGTAGSKYLVASADVPVISFTGSTQTGKAISAAGAVHLKRFGLELGGKTPMVVFPDANLDRVVPALEKALTVFAGQFCMTGSRLLVQREIAPALITRLTAQLENVRVGPASDSLSEMGPLIDRANVQRVNEIVEQAIAEGAKVLVRGGPITEGPLARGAFYRPTLLQVDDPEMDIVQNETFGPVLTLQIFDGESEAIALANNSVFGLAASVWTFDLNRALRVARELEAGTVWVNDWAKVYDEFEEGGFKQSGQGRLNGIAAMDDFIEYKHIALNPGEPGK